MIENASSAASMALPVYQWINLILLGITCGAIGQGARTIVSLKKISDAAQAMDVEMGDVIKASKIVTAFLIGGVAGALAAVTLVRGTDPISFQTILELIGAGYIGADFIEGFIARSSPADMAPRTSPDPSTATNAAPTPTPPTTPTTPPQDSPTPDANDGSLG